MSDRETIQFKCGTCGLLTPGMFEFPDVREPFQPIVLNHECHHCDTAMQITFKTVMALRSAIDRGIPVLSVAV